VKEIYSLGTSNRTQEEFLNILKKFNIQQVIDVRRFPTSKFEHFKKENLANFLEKEAIAYFWWGKELGGYRKEGYLNYTCTQEFKKYLKKLEELAKSKITCIICCERLYLNVIVDILLML
jgi:uncharacterized protein (DUF488 family)